VIILTFLKSIKTQQN